MSWPNRTHLEKQYKEFLDNGGPKFVKNQIQVLSSVGKHITTGEPWPAFHRCMICGQHPEVMGDKCIKVGPQHNLPFCQYCVTQMYEAVK